MVACPQPRPVFARNALIAASHTAAWVSGSVQLRISVWVFSFGLPGVYLMTLLVVRASPEG